MRHGSNGRRLRTRIDLDRKAHSFALPAGPAYRLKNRARNARSHRREYDMKRRSFLSMRAAASATQWLPRAVRAQVIQLDGRTALHPSLEPLMPLWHGRQLAIIQSVGYAQPNLSHFRSVEIWDTASHADEYLRDGWLTRAFRSAPLPAGFAADGVVIGNAEMGPLANGARARALLTPMQGPGTAKVMTYD